MGKSPGKWLKTVLFAKKSTKSHSSKGCNAKKAMKQKDCAEGKLEQASSVGSPIISQPLEVNSARNDPITQTGGLPSSTTNGVSPSPTIKDVLIVETTESDSQEKIREEQAAIKAQAAFRGFLARRAFRALQGIIRLQALIRGHLVRRQAVSTLHCMWGIVKFQALVRGRQVRLSAIRSDANGNFSRSRVLDTKQIEHEGYTSTQKISLSAASANPFIRKIISSRINASLLVWHYIQEEPNSVWNWLERWTRSRFWKPLPQPKKTSEVKSQARYGGHNMDTESGRSKRTVRRNFSASTDSGSTNTAKRNFKKVNSSTEEPVLDHAQSELEKVKRNLRKISNSTAQPSAQMENEIEKPKHGAKRASNLIADVSEVEIVDSTEKTKKSCDLSASDATEKTKKSCDLSASDATKSRKEINTKPALVNNSHVEMTPENSKPSEEAILHNEITPSSLPETKENMDAATDQLQENMSVNVPSRENPATEQEPAHGIVKDKKHASLNVDKTSNGENQKTNKRRSLPAKTEFKEDGLENIPTVPSYMAATQSAKAKLRGLSSPRLTTDGIEKNGGTRRHSLPSSTNANLQAQKHVQANGRGSFRNDRSYGHEKPIQVEWRR